MRIEEAHQAGVILTTDQPTGSCSSLCARLVGWLRRGQDATRLANAAVDVAPLLDTGRWTGYQKFVTALSAVAVIFDGFDILIVGFAIPSLMKEWGVGRPAFGPVLALGLVGMAVGSPFAGYWGDRFGRRPALIGCLTVFALATLATSFVNSVAGLAVLRFVTGLGAGGALPNAPSRLCSENP